MQLRLEPRAVAGVVRERDWMVLGKAGEVKRNSVPFRLHAWSLGETTQQFQPVIAVTDCCNSDKRIDDVFHGKSLRM